ncbi:hypothetical protein BIY21_12710 [Vibrio ponticus]|uniref:Ribosome recycling factor n=1 Tax=Vibrio ponticus TaxID=265668 RepID=A0ABX3FFW0_9VIBR|nr:ribosome recycling factor family protein [Vibrio ponticus]OLQ91871.1 hypothetical protein BIY21_12710 [Vibrio ponticus]
MDSERISVSLPSFIHRVGREQANLTRGLAAELGCELKRVRRSRNWQLLGEYHQIHALLLALRSLDSLKYKFTIGKLDTVLAQIEPPLTIEQQLAKLLETNPNITLAEMMEVTSCTLSEARTARFENDTL